VNEPRRSWRFEVRVERGKIVELARCLGSHDASFGTAGDPPETLVAPPTFPVVVAHWGVANREQLFELGYDATRVLHGEEHYMYPDGPLEEGELLEGETTVVEERETDSRNHGRLRIIRFHTELRQAADATLRAEIDRTVMEVENV
jgi:N-terminal half of MaoC dehydratase